MAILRGTIGGYSMLQWDTDGIQLSAEQNEDITPAGSDGAAFKKTGSRPIPFNVRTLGGATDDAGLVTLRNNYLALKSTLVSILEPGMNATYTINNVFVKELIIGKAVKVAAASSGYTWLLPATWTLVYTG